MKKFFILLAVAMVAACSQDGVDIVINDGMDLIITAFRENAASATKTMRDETGAVSWSAHESISLFYASGGQGGSLFTSTNDAPSERVDFSGTINVVTGVVEGDAERFFWGIYPYNEANSVSPEGTLTTVIPDQQTAAEGTFADNHFVSIGKSKGLEMGFYNLCGGFKFRLEHEGVTKVTLRGNNNEQLAGKVKVVLENGRPVVSEVVDAKTTLVMTRPNGESFQTGVDYFFVMRPITFENGFTFTMETADSFIGERNVGVTIQVKRSLFSYSSSAIDSGVVYHRPGNIEFADDVVKAICVARWDTDGDGELSFDEAAAVTTIPYSAFAGNTTITSFDEFQYFTGVSRLQYDGDYDEGMVYFGTFSDCTALTSISLPSTLQTITFGCFRGCSGLAKITIPASVTTIQQVAFLGCTNLDVYMESEIPCTLQKDSYDTYDEPYAFGFLTSGKVKTIYVPTQESVDTYKMARYWSTYKWIIKWVGEAPSGYPIPEAVDRGLTSGLKWASFNLGASKPEEYGDYFAWGETEPYYSSLDPLTWKPGKETGYDWPSYRWCQGSKYSLNKYCIDSRYGYNGFTDGKTELDLADDAAYVNLGDKWRIPTRAEQEELINSCTWTWATERGIEGYRVSSKKNGNSIFLPANGYLGIDGFDGGGNGDYWSASVWPNRTYDAYDMDFTSNFLSTNNGRCEGRGIRPVYGDRKIKSNADIEGTEEDSWN
ncbi:MAG: leucine-rich repeat protein [Bacteroidales bacterium]|nr:leucine-rich repeat protein [Bacteroidales bacterium]